MTQKNIGILKKARLFSFILFQLFLTKKQSFSQ